MALEPVIIRPRTNLVTEGPLTVLSPNTKTLATRRAGNEDVNSHVLSGRRWGGGLLQHLY